MLRAPSNLRFVSRVIPQMSHMKRTACVRHRTLAYCMGRVVITDLAMSSKSVPPLPSILRLLSSSALLSEDMPDNVSGSDMLTPALGAV